MTDRASGYAEPAPGTVPDLLTAADIDRIFRKPAGWFSRGKVRRRLYGKGFPRPVEAGRWSPIAVRHWIDNPTPPERPKPARPRAGAANGYAAVGP